MKNFLFAFLGIIVFLSFLWINVVIWGGEYFDKKCIKRKLNFQQSQLINKTIKTNLLVKPGDRIIASECSEFLRAIHLRDVEWWTSNRSKIQIYLFGDTIK